MGKQQERFSELDPIAEDRPLVLSPQYDNAHARCAVRSRSDVHTNLWCAAACVHSYEAVEPRAKMYVDMAHARPRSPIVPQRDDDQGPVVLVGDGVGDSGACVAAPRVGSGLSQCVCVLRLPA